MDEHEPAEGAELNESPRVALITGAAAGLGKAVAMELARRGWSLFVQHAPGATGVRESVADIQAVAQHAGQAVEVHPGAANLAATAEREALVERALEQFGRIDMLVNAALAAGEPGDLLEVGDVQFRAAMAGLEGTMFLTQLVANEMVRLVEGGEIENPRIVILNTLGAYTTSADHGPDCMARAGIAMLTKLFADRLSEHGINVYEVRCGLISAGAADAVHARYDALIAEGLTPIRRWGRPQDVARAVAAVAEDLLGFSTGEVLNVDGGFHLRRL